METLTLIYNYAVDNWYFVITSIITIATIIVKITPNKTDNLWLKKFVRLFEVLSGNAKPIELKDKAK